MNALHYRLHIERREPDLNMARFYALSIEATLFGQTCVVRRWGRIGTSGRTVRHSFDNESEAVGFFLALLRAKKLRGYRPRPAARHAEATPSA
ncbi:WGR domain-containing protein [bacterium M00.F.Ca.ET.230.01.1.1]|nr:WGR domain-containing protein [bacterium M00.F.Ca.ET.230.01.1.1]